MANIGISESKASSIDRETIRNDEYQQYILREGRNSLCPFYIENSDGQTIAYLFEMWLPHELKEDKIKTELTISSFNFIRDVNKYENDYNLIKSSIRKDFNCRTCAERASVLGRLVDKNGLIFCSNGDRSPAQHVARACCQGMYNMLEKYGIPLKIRILSPNENWLYKKRAGTELPNTPDWNHYHYRIGLSSDDGVDVDQCNVAVNQYLFQAVRLLSKFTDRTGALRSLGYINTIVNSETYADEYKGCVAWLIALVSQSRTTFSNNNLLKKMEIIAGSIFNTRIKKNNDSMVHIGVFSQAQSVLNWCENANDLASARRMVQKHMNPTTHKRPTAAPKAGAVKKAAAQLGNFTNTIMTTSEIVNFGAAALKMRKPLLHQLKPSGVVTLNMASSYNYSSAHRTSASAAGKSTAGAYEDLYAEASTNSTGVCGLAGREDSTRLRQREIERAERQRHDRMQTFTYTHLTIEELINEIQIGNIWSIKVDTTRNNTGCYVAKTTLSSDKLAEGMPHLWCYENSGRRFAGRCNRTSRLGCGTGGLWGDSVTHVYRWRSGTGHDCVLFVLEKSHETIRIKKLPNCCIPAFLSSEYFRSCGSTFEAINKKVDLSIPALHYPNGLALGVGSSLGNHDRGTLSPGGKIMVKINNQTSWISITNMY
jgi:hypothetical protein